MMKWMVVACAVMGLTANMANAATATPDARECEVCREVLEMVDKRIKSRTDQADVEKQLDIVCDEKAANSEARKKVCYFMTPIKREVSQLYKNGLPNDRICLRLKQKSSEICSVRNKIKVEKGNTNYNDLKVKDLKKILADRGVTCDGCAEKTEFVAKCMETEGLEGKRDGL